MSGREAAQRRAGREVATTQQPQQGGAAGTMRHMLEQMKPELALALPKHMTPERMARQALTAFRTTRGLDEVSPQSFLGALMTCAQVGLEPGPQGHVYILPFRNRGRMEATFILGYQGMLELARRSGELADVSAHTVYQNELDQGRFEVEYGTSGGIRHRPIVFGERGEPVGYYATATLKSGARPFVVLSTADVHEFRKRSPTQRENPSGPWSTDFEAMAWKTCVRRLSRWLPQSPELAAALTHEETAREVVPGNVTASVLEEQPPALDAADPDEDDMGADPVTGELPTGSGAAEPEPKAEDPWGDTGGDVPPPDPDDPWANK